MTNLSRQSLSRISIGVLGLLSGSCLYTQQALPSSPQPARSLSAFDSLSSSASSFSRSAEAALPDAPAPQPVSSSANQTNEQPKRILGIIPNFRAVSTEQHLPPQSVKEKFASATEDFFDYSALAIPVAVAGYNYLRNSTPGFGTGGAGYGRYLWHLAVDQTSENYVVEFFVPAATHENTRFYTLGQGSFFTPAGYALSRVVVTRSDAGNPTFNIAELVGAGISARFSSTYYPTRECSFSNTGSQWASTSPSSPWRLLPRNSGQKLIAASSTVTNSSLNLHHLRQRPRTRPSVLPTLGVGWVGLHQVGGEGYRD
jgi:hypothetical protein